MQQHETIEAYIQAIAIYNTTLKFNPNDLKALKRKGYALEKLSELQLEQEQHDDAIVSLKQAIATFDVAFSLIPTDAEAISYKGMVIERLAQLYSSRLQYAQALSTLSQAVAAYNTAIYTQSIENYKMAIAHYETSLWLKPMKVNTFALGQTLSKLGNCQEQLLQKSEALRNYHAALSLFNSALPPGDKHIRYVTQKIQKLVSS
jgi:tetratricopeptide (TPR) repeat protein